MSGSGTGVPIGGPLVLIVEDGSGKPDANSYCSVADADVYHGTYTRAAAWAAATQEAKENALMLGTQYLDLAYGSRWRGLRANGYGSQPPQGLEWPRMHAYDAGGWPYPDDALPVRLVQAACEAALRIVLGDDLLGVVSDPGGLTAESVSVGPISESKSYRGAKPYGKVYPKIEALVRPLVHDGGQVLRG